MSTDPSKPGSEQRPGGAEDKKGTHGQPGGHRSRSGSDYGDWVPDRGQPQRNDDLDADDPSASQHETGASDPMNLPYSPGSPRPRADGDQAGDLRTGVLGEPQAPAGKGSRPPPPDPDESAATESNRNKSFDTPHVHSSGSTRKV
ncbi:hypothetical protein [Piscinibacter sp. XHJ-5]|uniref:hypothetical protein n=1 Tax=Piscinibacter sp. XHJ-5 TaxID=3037797 RepID=UPI0024535B16|nr:hypothetical protein [Piscinibacter sp. XHJ-5]